VHPDAPPRRSLIGARPSTALIAVLIGLRLLVLVLAIHRAPTTADEDVHRFQRIASTEGRPYRDFPVEYAPLELLAIELIGRPGIGATATDLALVSCALDLAAFAAVAIGWGRRAGAMYLLLGLPLLGFLYFRLDPLPVALAAAGFALARKGDGRLGGVALALACLAKLWPLVLIPALLIDGRRRAFAWFAGAFGLGLVGWIAFGGVDAVRQVVTFRSASGWSIESTVGAIVWTLTGGPIRLEAGSARTGVVTEWARVALAIGMLVTVAVVWLRARSRDTGSSGSAATGALGGLLFFAPLFSVQYASWLLPWGAVASEERDGRGTSAMVLAIAVATGATIPLATAVADGSAPVLSLQLLLLVRDGLCGALALRFLRRPAREPNARPLTT
jgi:glycosyl transferase family 87